MMQDYFYGLFDSLQERLLGGEVLLSTLSGERSDFCRINHAKIRQAGHVVQATIHLSLVDKGKLVQSQSSLCLYHEQDLALLQSELDQMRQSLKGLRPDPYLHYSEEPTTEETRERGKLPATETMLEEFLTMGSGTDLVGFFAAGSILRGMATSLGHRHWYESESFNIDWSFYLHDDKAVKTGYAGSQWSPATLSQIVARAKEELAVMQKPARSINPGHYPVYLSPRALMEVMGLINWGGFSLKSKETKQSVLLRMAQGESRLADAVTIRENTAGGIGPHFDEWGFRKPQAVSLVDRGSFAGSLVSARSAKEFGVTCTGASSGEAGESLELAPGEVRDDEILKTLGTGIYVNNLWYLNYSDRTHCRFTGMTRFATFWVESGAIIAPLNVMRFDESLYRMLGSHLIGLTRSQSMLLSSDTYQWRSTASMRLPGALIRDMAFTL